MLKNAAYLLELSIYQLFNILRTSYHHIQQLPSTLQLPRCYIILLIKSRT